MKKRQSLKHILVSLYDACLCIKLNKTGVSNREIQKESLCSKDDSVSEEKAVAVRRRRRIKVVITRKQLDHLLAKQLSLEELVFANQRTLFRSLDDNKWKPRLESINETPEF
ncbi:unnamed protein product [Cochlearia groenlandica]